MMNEIIRELNKMGIYAEVETKIDNGVTKVGLSLSREETARVRPCIWKDSFKGDTPLEIALDISEWFSDLDVPTFDPTISISKDFILDHLYIGLQRTSEEDIVKQPSEFEGIEEYLYVRIDDEASYKLKPELMEKVGITLFQAWNGAYDNTCGTSVIKTMAEEMGVPAEMFEGMPLQIIVTNRNKWRGASAVLNKEHLRAWLDERDIKNTKFFMLPSSIHEVILLPYDEDVDLEGLSAMVKEINATQVEPEERLADRAYVMEVEQWD